MNFKFSIAFIGIFISSFASADFEQNYHQLELQKPKKGSLNGALSDYNPSLSGMTSGSVSIPSGFDLPSNQGKILYNPFPSYSTSNGMSEWGMGWKNSLSVTRWRQIGESNYSDDLFLSPWGILRLGNDNYWYTKSSNGLVKVEITDKNVTAWTPEGTIFEFGNEYIEGTSKGVYSYKLNQVRDARGNQTNFRYFANSTGKLFLSQVQYGGLKNKNAYSIELSYKLGENIHLPNFNSGKELTLDRLVDNISFYNIQEPSNKLRWSYKFDYRSSEYGPFAFLITQTKSFASGLKDRPKVFEYNYYDEFLESADFEVNPTLTSLYVRSERVLPLHGRQAAFHDFNNDGLTDFENARTRVRYIQTNDGFNKIQLKKLNTRDIEKPCYRFEGTSASPSRYFRLRGPYTEQHRISISGGSNVTSVVECDLEGKLISTTSLGGNYGFLLENDALMDLNQDGKPDLAYADTNFLTIFKNTSTSDSVSFEKIVVQGNFNFGEKVQYVDVNGDGIIDLVSQDSLFFTIYYGIGNFEYSKGVTTYLYGPDKSDTADPTDYTLRFADLNKDGLKDIIMTWNYYIYPMFNDGRDFVQKKLPALYGKKFPRFDKQIANLTGGRNQEFILSSSARTKVLKLNDESTGFLKSVDDGKGNKVTFSYKFLKGNEGLGSGTTVVRSITHSSVGLDDLTTMFIYSNPVPSSIKYQNLGYSTLSSSRDSSVTSSQFEIDEILGSTPISTDSSDKNNPNLVKQLIGLNEKFEYQGVSFLRPKSSTQRWKNGSAKITKFDEYYNGTCPKIETTTYSRFTSTVTNSFQSPSALSDHITCFKSVVSKITKHEGSPDRDFSHSTEIDLNDFGEPTEIRKVSGEKKQTIVTITYDNYGRTKTQSKPNLGTTSVVYENEQNFLKKLISPNGVVAEVTKRDPLSEIPSQLLLTRADKSYQTYYSFDGKERLERTWSDLSLTSFDNPLNRLEYYEFSDDKLPYISSYQLNPKEIFTKSSELFAGNGSALGRITESNDSYLLNSLKKFERSNDESHSYRSIEIDGIPNSLTQFYKNDDKLSSAKTNGLGLKLNSQEAIDFDSEKYLKSTYTIDGIGLSTKTIENNSFSTVITTGLQKEILSITDQANHTYRYQYDGDNKLLDITLPNQSEHSIEYDLFARISRSFRDGIGGMSYEYQDSSDLVEKVDFLDKFGKTYLSLNHQYDIIGRVKKSIYSSGVNSKEYSYFYDGEHPFSDLISSGQTGMLTGVSSPEFSKSFVYSLDEKLKTKSFDIHSFAKLKEEFEYYNSGETKVEQVHLDIDSKPLVKYRKSWIYDDLGRIISLQIDDKPVFILSYNDFNQIDNVSFDVKTINFQYDEKTRAYSGHCIKGRTSNCYSISKDDRGFIESETIQFDSKVSERAYEYEGRGFLDSSSEDSKTASYLYDETGLNTLHSVNFIDKKITPTLEGVDIGGVKYKFDKQGRLSHQSRLVFKYGLDNQVASISDGNKSVSYSYDENQQRILKINHDGSKVAWVGNYTIKGGSIFEIVKISSITIGYLKNGKFTPLLSDLRGSKLEGEQNRNWVDSYGNRDMPVTEAEFWDYTGKSKDSFTGLIRMGVRDFDPTSGRFTTPDPLFLASPEMCVKSPIECNLYSYAKNNPLKYTDPTGTIAFVPLLIAAGAGIAADMFFGSEKANAPGTDGRVDTSMSPENIAGLAIGGAALTKAAVKHGPALVSKGAQYLSPTKVTTPWGTAKQSLNPKMLNFRSDIKGGQSVYRQGHFGKQETGNAQFWAKENPLSTPGYDAKYGTAVESSSSGRWIMKGTVRSDTPVVTRGSPAYGNNPGGAPEAVVKPGDIKIDYFHMPD